MKPRLIFWITFALIILLCWFDYQYFTEGRAWHYTPIQRQIGHFVILLLIIPIGYLGWKQNPEKSYSTLWMFGYGFAISFIGLLGLIQWKTGMFSTEFLDYVSGVRLFFTSPLPWCMLYVLSMVAKNKKTAE